MPTDKQRYANDPEYREKIKADALRRYHAQKTPETLARMREANKARYHSDPEYRKKVIESSTRWNAENKVAVRRNGREGYARKRASRVCQITGLVSPRSRYGAAPSALVDAAHIKPKRYCGADECSDKDNILNMDVRLHRLFDGLLMMVAPNGELMFDSSLPNELVSEWAGARVERYSSANDAYMSFHRRLCYYHGFTECSERGVLGDAYVAGKQNGRR